MNLRPATSALLGTLTLLTTLAPTTSQSVQLHGSGTTNPSKCFWHIMDKLEEQIKIPSRLTYRAVGSGTGIKEFLGKDINGVNDYLPYNDFGAGDIPIDADDRTAWNDEGIEFVQLPFVLSAVSFFHNIPGVPTGDLGLNMTACLLARVFDGDITTWDHVDIKAINPGLNVPDGYPIYVGRRVLGSSSTYSITNYLHAQCPRNANEPKGWPAVKVGSEIVWDSSTHECDGSSAMTKCIKENEGAIGYIDSAHGHEEDLNEIRLKNGDGLFLTAKEAGEEGIQAAAVDLEDAPFSANGDFSNLAFYNKPGPNTWPITLVSYLYIRQDLSHISDPASRTLLKAFASTLFKDDYIGLCERYGLIPVPDDLKTLSLEGINLIDANVNGTLDPYKWTFEVDTAPGTGQGDYVISKKRQSFTLYEADRLADDVSVMEEEIRVLKLELAQMRANRAAAGSNTASDESSGVKARFSSKVGLGLSVLGAVAGALVVGL